MGQTSTTIGSIDHCPQKVTHFEVKVIGEDPSITVDKYVHAKVLSWSKQDTELDHCMIKVNASVDHLPHGCIDVIARDKEGRPRITHPLCNLNRAVEQPLNLLTEIPSPCKIINSIGLQGPH